MPVVISQVYSRLNRMGDSLANASMDLGANRWHTLWSVIMPNLVTPIVGSSLLVFALAFDELPGDARSNRTDAHEHYPDWHTGIMFTLPGARCSVRSGSNGSTR